MDPTTCFQQWLDLKVAIEATPDEDHCDDIFSAKEFADNLIEWLQDGGFTPDQWADPEHGNDLRREFCGWCEKEWWLDAESIRELLINASAKGE